MALSYADVGEILKMIDTSSCAEVILELDGIKMVVRKGGQGSSTPESSAIPGESLSGIDTPTKEKLITQTSPQQSTKAVSAEAVASKGDIIKSPMVGTFYSKPSPEEPPFVIAGQEVKKGDTLCLIEVMKLFTAVECTADGTVEMIFAEDGALVEFDQPLFSIA
jgi:acetyl-CoA carboxylase biotin carboxyl carrier protein